MDRALAPPLSLSRRWIALGLLGAILLVPNVLLLRESLGVIGANPSVWDWELLVEAHARIGSGTMYDWDVTRYTDHSTDYLYRYSPVLPYVMGPVIEYGLPVWRLLHVAALIALPVPVAVIALLSGPFWFDIAHGNFLVFIAVAGYLALRGNRWGMGIYFVLCALMPRPLMLPLAAWLVWKRPESRPILLGVLAVMILLTLATGEAFAWLGALTQGTDMIGTYYDWGPSRFIGLWWLPIGLTLGAWLTWKGRVGFAALAVSPYILPYYLLVLGWELTSAQASRAGSKKAPQ